MSIWSSRALEAETLWTVGYGPPGSGDEASEVLADDAGFIDLATATPWYGVSGLRLTLTDDMGDMACVVLPRETARAIRNALDAWLGEVES